MHPSSGSTALLTDQYELTMLQAALADGSASRRCTFEVFARRLPNGRRYGVVAGTARVLDAVENFRFTPEVLTHLQPILDAETLDHLARWRFDGDIDGYPEGELFFPDSPVLSVTGSFGSAVILETVILSILNHDCAIASAAARMRSAAADRTIIEMGSRRTHEEAAVAASRAAYIAGFTATSNLGAGFRYGIPTAGTAAHAFTLLHDTEAAAFAAQVESLGKETTLLVDTYDITRGIATAIEVVGPNLGAIRIDSGDLGVLARAARDQLDALGAVDTKVVLSGDLDEYAIAALRAEPVDVYGVGTALVTGSGAPTAGMVYKMVEVDGRPVAKRSLNKQSTGGAKGAIRRHRSTGTATEELVYLLSGPVPEPLDGDRTLPVPLMRSGVRVDGQSLQDARDRLTQGLVSLPWEGLKLSQGDPALPTVIHPHS
ncbi:nicotinate phosphoribosyltransferase [Nakamurella panacisegetis]|uniref:Nicotinate phosphoribosyltransferase n=1 Tax=Nakamurella panacisegetis TaxID=1090615 RepID=A0A1H0HE25_9ACTN|nr:nicotinate phosphoribosyltransferase [Nakamurella panacisegetis]SDO17101.1 nicotinate phosphoribosyltransferase [Nakamurella panacisegetis]